MKKKQHFHFPHLDKPTLYLSIGNAVLLIALIVSFFAIPTRKYIITLTNTGKNPTTSLFQQRVDIPLSKITKVAKDYSNIDFAYSSGTKVPAWLEKVDSSTNTGTWWLRINKTIEPGVSVEIELLTYPNSVLGKNSGQNSALFSGYDNGNEVFLNYASFQGKSLPDNVKLYTIPANSNFFNEVGSEGGYDPSYFPAFIGGKTKSGGLEMTNSKRGESTAAKFNNEMISNLPQIIEFSWSVSNGTNQSQDIADDIGVGFFTSNAIVASAGARWSPFPAEGYYASFEFFHNTPPALVIDQEIYPALEQTLPTSGEHMMFSSVVIDSEGVQMAYASSSYHDHDLYRYAPPSSEMKTCLTKKFNVSTFNKTFYVGASASVDTSTIRLYFVRNYILAENVSSTFKAHV